MRDTAHEGHHGQRDDAILTLLYDTGLRRGELAQVDRAMLDLDEELLRIPPGIQKDYPNENTPDPETFALDRSDDLRTTQTLRAYLNTRDDESAALFPSQKSDRLTGKSTNDVVKRAAATADVRPYTYAGRGCPADVSAHTLRHSVAWRMLRAEEGNTLYDVLDHLVEQAARRGLLDLTYCIDSTDVRAIPADQDASKCYDPTADEYYYSYGCTIVSTGQKDPDWSRVHRE